MNKAFRVAAVYIGLIIGAGFASGREILQYFNFPSNTNITGVLIATFLFMWVAYMILSKSAKENICDFDSYIAAIAGRAAPFVKFFMLAYMFCGLFVMFSGSAALTDALSPLPDFFGALFMAAICFITLSFDLRGIVTLNIILVPLMICGIFFVSVCAALFADVPVFSSSDIAAGGGIVLSAVCYAAYNTVTAGAVLVPLANDASIRSIRRAVVSGGFCIGLLIMLIWTVQSINFDFVKDSELPMLTLASLCGKLCKRTYTAVLFMAICTTAVSYGFGIMSHFSHKIKTTADRIIFAAVLCLSALPLAMYGFSNLIAGLYSIFGYIGIIWIIMVAVDRYK